MRYYSMMLAIASLVMLSACSKENGNNNIIEGCSNFKGKSENSVASTKMINTVITCSEIEENYTGYNITATNEIIMNHSKYQLVEDGNAPEWAPKTITITGMIGCIYTPKIRNDNDMPCSGSDPELYYGTAEAEIKMTKVIPNTKDPYAEGFSIILSTERRISLGIWYGKDENNAMYYDNGKNFFFRYEALSSIDNDSDAQPDGGK